MRTKELKVENKKIEAVLMAGGNGFKIYSVAEPEGWVIAKGRKIYFFEEGSKDSEIIINYINLNYQSVDLKESIKAKFEVLLRNVENSKSTSQSLNP